MDAGGCGARPMLQASDRANIHVSIVGVSDDAFLHIDGWDFGAVNANHGRSLLGMDDQTSDLTVKNSRYDGHGAFTNLTSWSDTGTGNITLQNCDFYAPNSAALGLRGWLRLIAAVSPSKRP